MCLATKFSPARTEDLRSTFLTILTLYPQNVFETQFIGLPELFIFSIGVNSMMVICLSSDFPGGYL